MNNFTTKLQDSKNKIKYIQVAETLGLGHTPTSRVGHRLTKAFAVAAIGISFVQTACSRETDHSTDSQTMQVQNQPSMQGSWAKLSVFTSQSSALGITAQSSVGRYSLVNMTAKNDGTWAAVETLCDVQTKSSGSSSITFSDRLVRSIETNSYTYQVGANTLTMPQAIELLGARLNNKQSDPLSSSTQYDQDKDGNPGVSVDVSARVIFTTLEGQVYVMQRTTWSEQGQWQGPGRIKGYLNWNVEQKTLGASNPLLNTVSPTITTMPEASPFYLVKLPEGATCGTVLSLQGRDLPNL